MWIQCAAKRNAPVIFCIFAATCRYLLVARRTLRPTVRKPCCSSHLIVASFAYLLRTFSETMEVHFVREGNDKGRSRKDNRFSENGGALGRMLLNFLLGGTSARRSVSETCENKKTFLGFQSAADEWKRDTVWYKSLWNT